MSGKSLIFGEEARDAAGRIDVGRSLADMLPAEPVARPASPARQTTAQIAALAFVGAAVLIGLFAMLRSSAAPAPAAQPQPSAQPSPAAPAAAAAPATPSATAASGCTLVQTTPTYYAPGGDIAPIALERGAACTVLAWHSLKPDWRQIRIAGQAPIWVPLSAISEQAPPALDLAPPPTPTPAPATAAPVVIVKEVPAAPPPPEPTRCASYQGGGVSVERCGAAPIEQLQAQALDAWKERMQP